MLFIFNYLQCRAWGKDARSRQSVLSRCMFYTQLLCTQCKRMVDLRIKCDAARLGIKRCFVRDK